MVLECFHHAQAYDLRDFEEKCKIRSKYFRVQLEGGVVFTQRLEDRSSMCEACANLIEQLLAYIE